MEFVALPDIIAEKLVPALVSSILAGKSAVTYPVKRPPITACNPNARRNKKALSGT